MRIIGLTGSIGMGKTTVAHGFRRLGILVHDSDAVVHNLLASGGSAVAAVASVFPESKENGAINRQKLGAAVFGNTESLHTLESILHPMVSKDKNQFLQLASYRRSHLVVLDSPLLFETGGDKNCDAIVTVTAPAFVQMHRVLSRPGMTKARFDQVLEQQISDTEKRRRSDFVLPTGLGYLESFRQIRKIVGVVSLWPPRHWPPWTAGRRP